MLSRRLSVLVVNLKEKNTFWIISGLVFGLKRLPLIVFRACVNVGPHLTRVSTLWSEKKCASIISQAYFQRLSVGFFIFFLEEEGGLCGF